jgi:hypothetical protein
VDSRGAVSWLALDLATRWQRTLSNPAVAAALDPFGQYLAVADAGARLHLIDRRGRVHFQVQTHRPLHHLAFVPEAPRLVGCADFGLVAGFDPDGRCLWRDGLVAHLGALAVSGDGMCLALACFTEGLRFYALDGSKQGSLPLPESCRLVDVTFDGRFLLAGGASNHLLLRSRDGRAIADLVLDMPPVALALAPLGGAGVIALPDGRLVGLDLPDAAPR